MSNLFINRLAISHIDNAEEVVICRDFSISISSGEIIGIIGPNGCGKTSLLKAVLEGIGIVDGDITFEINKSNINYQSIRKGYIPQDYQKSFFQWLSLKDNIKLIRPESLKSKASFEERFNEVKRFFNIEFDFKLKPRYCSGGMIQQASIIRAFISDPQVIVGDEPFSNLDANVSNSIRNAFRQIIKEPKSCHCSQELICILILHSVDDMALLCDKIIYIPNKPFTSSNEQLDGFHKVHILENHIKANIENHDELIIDKIKKILS